MELTKHIYLVGSGRGGFDLTDDFDCHVYAIEVSGEIALVDIGFGRRLADIMSNLRSHGLREEQVRYLMITHPHADHCGGTAELTKLLPNLIVVAHPVAADLIRRGDEAGMALDRARAAGFYPSDYRLKPASVHRDVKNGDSVKLGGKEIKVIETPGHSVGSVSYLIELDGRNCLFSGDVVFHGGRISLENTGMSSVQDYARTFDMLSTVSVDALFPGHLTFSLRNGKRHIEAAATYFRNLSLPPQV